MSHGEKMRYLRKNDHFRKQCQPFEPEIIPHLETEPAIYNFSGERKNGKSTRVYTLYQERQDPPNCLIISLGCTAIGCRLTVARGPQA
jgi:hypothetical protein